MEPTENQQQTEISSNESTNTSTNSSVSEPSVTQADLDSYFNNTINEKLNSNPEFKKFLSYQEFLNSTNNKKPSNPFETGVGLDNVTDAASYLHQNLTEHEKKLLEIEQKAAYLEHKEAVRDYEATREQFNSYWEGKYPDQESFNNAFIAAVKADQGLTQRFVQAQQLGGGLDAGFIAQVHQVMSNLWLAQLDDPNSGALDNLIKEAQRKKALQNRSMMNSNVQTTDSQKDGVNMYSSRLTIFDD